jgi:hypothetical protein
MIPAVGIWSAAWTRALFLSHIPAIFRDRIYYVDKRCENGRQRDWFVELWLERRAIPVWLMSQSFQTSGTSVTLSGLSPAWNNANNTVEGVGGGGSGGASQRETANNATGGGGGEYRKINNFTDPGGATSMTIGQGGGAVSGGAVGAVGAVNGNDGTNTTWNTSTLIAVGGKKGLFAITNVAVNGGVGGTGGTGAAGNNDGGRGGNITGTPSGSRVGTGGGGAGGPNGAGNAGTDAASASNVSTAGGQGDGTSGGASAPATTNGNPGTELGDGVHGCGGGGGGGAAGSNSTILGGSGGLYGGGGGGVGNNGAAGNGSTRATAQAAANGIIVLTWTAAVSFTWQDYNPSDAGDLLRRAIPIIGY